MKEANILQRGTCVAGIAQLLPLQSPGCGSQIYLSDGVWGHVVLVGVSSWRQLSPG